MGATATPPVQAVSALPQADTTTKQIRGSSLLLAGRMLSMAINFAVQILIVRYLSKSDYGAFAYGLSIVALGASFATFGLDRAITRFVSIYDEQRAYDKMFGTIVMVVGTVVALGLTTVLLAYGLQGFVAGSLIHDQRAVSLLLILIILSPIQALDTLLLGMFAVFSRPRAIFFRKNVLAPGLRLAVVLVLVLGHTGVFFLVTGYVVSAGVGVAIYTVVLYRALRDLGLYRHFSFGTIAFPAREVFGFTIPVLTSDLVYTVMNSSDAILLGHFGSASDVAAFRVIQPAAQLNQLVMSSFTLLFTPLAARLFARNDRGGINKLYWQTAVWMAILSFPVFTLTFSLANPITVALYGGRYEASATYLALLSFAYYFNAAVGFNGLTLKVFGRLRYIVVINVLAAAVNIGINLLLIPRYGALGAAIGTSSTLVAHNLLKQAGLRLGTGISLFQRASVKVYLTIVAGALLLLAVQLTLSPSLLVGLALAAITSFAVIGLNRRSLRVGERFPELLRFRLVRVLLGE